MYTILSSLMCTVFFDKNEVKIMATTDVIGMGASALGTIAGLASGNKENEQLIAQQEDANRRLMNDSYALQKNMFDYTYKSVKDKAKEFRDAGLNEALAYGLGANSGAGTTGSGSASVTGAVAANKAQKQAANSQSVGMTIQAGLASSQRRLMDAEAEKAQAEAMKLKGVDTQKVTAEIAKIETDTRYQAVATELETIRKDIETMSATSKIETMQWEAKIKRLQSQLSEDTYDTAVNAIKQDYVNKVTNNLLTEKNIEMADEQIKAVSASIKQRWEEIRVQWKNADSAQRNSIAAEETANIRRDRPSVGDAAGQILQNGINAMFEQLEKMDEWAGTKSNQNFNIE